MNFPSFICKKGNMMNATEREELLKVVEEINNNTNKIKIVYVDKTNWTNVITKRKQTIEDLFFLGYKDSSCNVKCINTIKYREKTYYIHDFLSHVNLEGDTYSEEIKLDNDEELKWYCQDFCSPIHGYNIFKTKGIEKILKGQMMGQNSDSPYQTVCSVINEGYDYVIKDNTGRKLKNNTSTVELLTRLNSNLGAEYITGKLRETSIPDKNEIAVKFKKNEYYTNIKEADYEKGKNNISTYYPIITHEECQDLISKIPKSEYDFTVIGLGSAGTGILDQVARSTYFKNYLLIDFDTVEEKNLRNQWYTKDDTNALKIRGSRRKILEIKDANIQLYGLDFRKVALQYCKSKYVVSGFDNLECRMELLDKCLTSFETKYLIDLRYLDYSCSIYFVDLQDEKQVKYYRNLLSADMEAFEEKRKFITTREELMKYWDSKNYFRSNCVLAWKEYFQENRPSYCGGSNCYSELCRNTIWEQFQKSQPKIEIKEESSCVRENFIDIYKYASSFVFSAIREIENGNDKPFTHIEAQTNVIPTSVVIKA